MANQFASTMVEDYTKLGLATREGDLAMRSNDGKTLVELEGREEEGATVGLHVFANSVLVEELAYTDPEFSRKLATALLALLDA